MYFSRGAYVFSFPDQNTQIEQTYAQHIDQSIFKQFDKNTFGNLIYYHFLLTSK